jgi:predicted ArsR family transcriptional regulator
MTQGVEHIPDEKSRLLVKSLSAVGIRYIDIAQKLDITDDTLRKHYKKELEEGRIDANTQMGTTLFQQAKAGNTTALIFWLKTRAGWKETSITEHVAGEGQEIKGINMVFVEANGNQG